MSTPENILEIERILFLLIRALGNEIIKSPTIDVEDKQRIAKFSDDRRGMGW